MKRLPTLFIVATVGATLLSGCGSDPVKPTSLPPSNVTVDWEQPFPPAIVTDITGFSSTDVYAVGGGGMILHYTGAIWSIVDSPTREDLTSIWRVNDQLVAVGGGGTILRLDGGKWRTEPSGTAEYLRGVWGSSADSLYAVGNHATVVRYTGTHWEPVSSPPFEWPECVWGTTGDNVYVGALDSLYHFDGQHWSNTGIEPRRSLWDIWGASRDDIWVSEGTNWLWHYDGQSWKTIIPNVNYPFTDLWGLAANDVFGVGDDGFVSHYDGVNWSEESLGDFLLLANWAESENDRWVGGFIGSFGATGVLFHFDGNEWTRSGELLSDRLDDIWSDPKGDRAIAVGYDGNILEKKNSVWHAVDPITSENLNAVWSAPAGPAYAVGDNGTCLRRTGQNWASIDLGTAETFSDIWGSGSSDIYIASWQGVWHYDGGSWGKQDVMDAAYSVWGSDREHVYVAGTDSISGVIRHFDGSTWKTIYSNEGTSVNQLTGYANSAVFAVFQDGGGLQPENIRKYDGHEWTDVTPPQIHHFNAVGACENFGLVAVGYNLEGGGAVVDESVYLLKDNEWVPLDTGHTSRFSEAFGLDGGVYFVGGASIVRCHH